MAGFIDTMKRLKEDADYAKKTGKVRAGQGGEEREKAIDEQVDGKKVPKPDGNKRNRGIDAALEDAGASNGKPKRKRTMADAIDDGIEEAKDA